MSGLSGVIREQPERREGTAKRRRRANFTAQQNVAVSDLCDQHGIQPSQFYTWQKQFFEQGARAFEGERNGIERRQQRRLEALEAKLRQQDEVIAEVRQELVRTKRGLGEL